jgi:hypothetical protein
MLLVLLSTPSAERAAVIGLIYFINYSGVGGPVIAVGAAALAVRPVTATRVAVVVITVSCAALIPAVLRLLRPSGPAGADRLGRGTLRCPRFSTGQDGSYREALTGTISQSKCPRFQWNPDSPDLRDGEAAGIKELSELSALEIR